MSLRKNALGLAVVAGAAVAGYAVSDARHESFPSQEAAIEHEVEHAAELCAEEANTKVFPDGNERLSVEDFTAETLAAKQEAVVAAYDECIARVVNNTVTVTLEGIEKPEVGVSGDVEIGVVQGE